MVDGPTCLHATARLPVVRGALAKRTDHGGRPNRSLARKRSASHIPQDLARECPRGGFPPTERRRRGAPVRRIRRRDHHGRDQTGPVAESACWWRLWPPVLVLVVLHPWRASGSKGCACLVTVARTSGAMGPVRGIGSVLGECHNSAIMERNIKRYLTTILITI